MKNVAQLQAKFIALYEEMYGFAPDFGSFKDWQDTNWLIRMYDDLYKLYNSDPEEFWDQVPRGTWFHVIKTTPI